MNFNIIQLVYKFLLKEMYNNKSRLKYHISEIFISTSTAQFKIGQTRRNSRCDIYETETYSLIL